MREFSTKHRVLLGTDGLHRGAEVLHRTLQAQWIARSLRVLYYTATLLLCYVPYEWEARLSRTVWWLGRLSLSSSLQSALPRARQRIEGHILVANVWALARGNSPVPRRPQRLGSIGLTSVLEYWYDLLAE